MTYAGFWRRALALLFDSVLLSAAMFGVGGLLLRFIADKFGISSSEGSYWLRLSAETLLCWLYFALSESSAKQGTIGKRACGIMVTDMNGARVGFWRATGRHFAKFISVITLFIGYIAAAFTEKKQGLHDIAAGCLVVMRTAPVTHSPDNTR